MTQLAPKIIKHICIPVPTLQVLQSWDEGVGLGIEVKIRGVEPGLIPSVSLRGCYAIVHVIGEHPLGTQSGIVRGSLKGRLALSFRTVPWSSSMARVEPRFVLPVPFRESDVKQGRCYFPGESIITPYGRATTENIGAGRSWFPSIL